MPRPALFPTAFAALALTAVHSAAAAQATDNRPTYKQFGALGGLGDGYKQKQVKDGWQVTAIIRASKPPASATAMALYRAAEVARSGGFSNVQIVSFKAKELQNYAAGMMFTSGYTAKIVFTGSNARDAANHCSANVSAACVTYDAAAALAELRPSLKIEGN